MLFNKEKDFILKIANLVLIVWLITGITILQIDVVDVLFKKDKLTYEKYEKYYCNDIKNTDNNLCTDFYNSYLTQFDNKNKMKRIVLSTGNVIIVSLGLYFLNKERKRK